MTFYLDNSGPFFLTELASSKAKSIILEPFWAIVFNRYAKRAAVQAIPRKMHMNEHQASLTRARIVQRAWNPTQRISTHNRIILKQARNNLETASNSEPCSLGALVSWGFASARSLVPRLNLGGNPTAGLQEHSIRNQRQPTYDPEAAYWSSTVVVGKEEFDDREYRPLRREHSMLRGYENDPRIR
ncbi:hypothetical protein K440DRAFT_637341 [Wilcoxina mikolae CBS 423.85]|nr:hypothetical protein K440DRAFT_637341 [Wilcoxina mikolae CBS 423.85]